MCASPLVFYYGSDKDYSKRKKDLGKDIKGVKDGTYDIKNDISSLFTT